MNLLLDCIGGTIMATKRIPWIRLKVEPVILKELTARSDAKGFRQVLIQLAVTMALGILSYWAFKTQPLWISIPVFFIYATVYSFSGYTAAIHELSHNTVFKTKWLNELFIIIFSFMSWSDYVYFRISHTQHHAYTTHHDLDKEVVLPVTLRGWRFVLNAIFNTSKLTDDFSGILGIFRRALGIIKEGREAELFNNNEKVRNEMIRWNRLLILAHVVVATFIVITGEWLLLLLITFAIFFGQWYNMLVSLTQHTGMEPDVTDFRKNCRSVILGPIGGFLYWQMHYHIEHHMYGGVPFYNLKKLRAVLEDQLPERKNLAGAWIEIIDATQKQKADPGYHVPVVFPE